ncbi:hypothetical protein BC834DRAFT_830694 [Gloeopeniophorella convolvens]|nr:hypothetical protein BC834DRAFT_830694 [Gloeopeniophorella convolvens]
MVATRCFSSQGRLLSLGFSRPTPSPIYGVHHQTVHSLGASSSLPKPPSLPSLTTPKDASAARDWLRKFKGCSIPRTAVELAFSRSSGPGGQNVNKLNTKATVRCALDSIWIPLWSQGVLQESSYFVKSSRSILMTSSIHRSQALNVEDCLSKVRTHCLLNDSNIWLITAQLHALICDAASKPIQNEPSEEQKERVRGLERAASVQRRLQKDRRSQTKNLRANFKLDRE